MLIILIQILSSAIKSVQKHRLVTYILVSWTKVGRAVWFGVAAFAQIIQIVHKWSVNLTLDAVLGFY